MWFSILGFLANGKKLIVALLFALGIVLFGLAWLHWQTQSQHKDAVINALQGDILQKSNQITACNLSTENFQNQAKLATESAVQKQKEIDAYLLKKYERITKTEYLKKDATCDEVMKKITEVALSKRT